MFRVHGGVERIASPTGCKGHGLPPGQTSTLQLRSWPQYCWQQLFGVMIGPDRESCANVTTLRSSVAVINSGSAKDPLLMQLLRCLFFYAAYYKFSVTARHLPGMENTGADAISRDNATLFLSTYPQANQVPVPIPPALTQLAMLCKHDWRSRIWKQLVASTLSKALPSPPHGPTGQHRSDT